MTSSMRQMNDSSPCLFLPSLWKIVLVCCFHLLTVNNCRSAGSLLLTNPTTRQLTVKSTRSTIQRPTQSQTWKRFATTEESFLTNDIAAIEDHDNDDDNNADDEALRLGRKEFSKYFDFPLDDWQLIAGGSILMGYNVIVCAPTGSGKTVIGEMALHYAYNKGLDATYTTPLKALSNEKFVELRSTFGADDVGLSTGDISINRNNARITVMTTEVYRNIAWRSSASMSSDDDDDSTMPAEEDDRRGGDPLLYMNNLRKNAVVILDEFHYMGQPGRGGVWEECVITSPPHTQIVGLSATLPNALQLAEWMESVTGRPTKLVDAPGARPVPLKYLFATREGLFPLFRNENAGPGSPLGLLGYRGDGISPKKAADKKMKKRAKGFGQSNDDDDDDIDEKLPKGLQINPALSSLAQRRMQKVNRMIERQNEQQRARRESRWDDEWDTSDGGRSGGRGRGRGRDRDTDRWETDRRRMTTREERKERERITRREMRKAVPSLPILLTRLNEKKLLPAIFFIFSRAGCDQAAETISASFKGPRDPTVNIDFDEEADRQRRRSRKEQRWSPDKTVVEDVDGRSFRVKGNFVDESILQSVFDARRSDIDYTSDVSGSPLSKDNAKFYSSAGLLSFDEVRQVANRVSQFNIENEEIALPDETIEQLLFGIGRHHAGMLPAHKMLVETLFRSNLMRAVFATETLAAGINMPARTTVVCALAKRGGGGSMDLLETSNLLQMAGRAGRRGKDTDGTCVLVASPFEGEDVAAAILTSPIKPISSQFRPSYSLAVNLIARGNGKLDVAKQLVSKSFANWGKMDLENKLNSAVEKDSSIGPLVVSVAEEKFLNTLIEVFDGYVDKRSAQFDIAFLSRLTGILKDREQLKKTSKAFDAAMLAVELESTTLSCLELELKQKSVSTDEDYSRSSDSPDIQLDVFFEEDRLALEDQVKEQQLRLQAAEKQLIKHPFTSIATIANKIVMKSGTDESKKLLSRMEAIFDSQDTPSLDGADLARIAKSSVVVKRKLRKLAKSNPDVDPEALLLEKTSINETMDSSWEDLLAITRVLVAYGCVVPTSGSDITSVDNEQLEEEEFIVTPAGTDVGMLSAENSLWFYIALGGTWDVGNVSSNFDELKKAMQVFDDDLALFDGDDNNDSVAPEQEPKDCDNSQPSKAQEEAELLVSRLRELTPGEMAGYIACLVTGDTARSTVSSIEVFQRLDVHQQRSIQTLLEVTERFMDVQRRFDLDERICNCQFDLSHCEVVTAWANGCTWQEALEISGAAPGDLTRIIGRALDAVRQIGSLKFNPLRKGDFDETGSIVDPMSRGIHPEVRRLCRSAAKAMNRYPVKDPLPFEVDEDEVFDVLEVNDDDDENINDSNDDDDDSAVDEMSNGQVGNEPNGELSFDNLGS